MKPRFAVIIPLYNKAPYVRTALESVLAQTYVGFEVIVVDDGSTDGSCETAEEFALQFQIPDIRFQIIRQPNAGVAVARNNGVAHCNGEYICFLDADDWWEPNFLEEMEQLIRAYPDAGLYGMNYIYYKPGKTHVAITKSQTGYINYPKAYMDNGAMMIFTSSSSMRRDVFDAMGGFPLGVKLGEDFLLWAKTSLHYRVAFCDKPLAYYNNDVPATMRATRNLHAPQYHMLFLLEPLEKEIEQSAIGRQQSADWKKLLDWLRANGLMPYWMRKEYHDIAAVELAKVDWSKQPKSMKAEYDKPIWYLRAKQRFMQTGSYWKQRIVRLFK